MESRWPPVVLKLRSGMTASARLLVIINPVAARARREWARVAPVLAENGISFDAYETKRAGDAEGRAGAALRAGYPTIAVVGGDGTLSEAASGFFESYGETDSDTEFPAPINTQAALAILPAGTGDDFARGLMRAPQSLDRWLARLVSYCARSEEERASATRTIDVLRGTTDDGARRFICLNAATLGIGPEVAAAVGAQKSMTRRLPGEARFALAATQALARWRNRPVRVRVDGSEWQECGTNLITVGNGPFAGGGMMFAPAAQPDDGLLDVLIVCGISRRSLVRELTRIHRGGHLANPRVHLTRGAHARIETIDPQDSLPVEADGNLRGHTPAEFGVIPNALRIVW